MEKFDVVVNGTTHSIEKGTNIIELLEIVDIEPKGVAIALDDAILPKEKWASQTLIAPATISIFRAIAGG